MLELLKSKTMVCFAIFVLGFIYWGAKQDMKAIEEEKKQDHNYTYTIKK